MEHLEHIQLMAWHDGEIVDPAERTRVAGHVAACASCRATVDAFESIGRGMQAWTDDAAHVAVESAALADAVFAAVRLDATSTSPAGEQAVPGAAAGAGDARPADTSQGIRVRAARRWMANWVVAPAVLGIAAFLVAVVRHGPPPRSAPYAGVQSGGRPVQEPGPTLHRPSPRPLVGDPGGSDLTAIDFDGDATNVSVVQVEGAREGTTVAVVFIEDGYDDDVTNDFKLALK